MGDKIPWDAWREILVCLPAKSLVRSRAVCKTWLSIIDDPFFVTTHTNKQQLSSTILIRDISSTEDVPRPSFYSVDLETLNSSNLFGGDEISATPLNFTASGALSFITDLRDVAACNGLMLILAGSWEIWNPLTNERLELPHRVFNPNIVCFGLGYDSANQDLKAVVVDCKSYRPKSRVFETHVYSLKSDSWRKIMDYPHVERAEHMSGVFLGGALHWITVDDDDDRYKITALSLGTESYRELKMPPFRETNENERYQGLLDVLGGCLVVSDNGGDFFDLWVRKEYGAEDSWTRVFQRNGSPLESGFFSSLIPVVHLKKKTQVFMEDEEGFCLLDLESGSVKRVYIDGLSGGHLAARAFHGTVFRLHDNCGGGRESETRKTRKIKRMADKKLLFRVGGA